MEPLIVLVVVTVVLLALGAAGVPRLRPWPVALRGGLGAMFVLTGVAHFVGKRAELVAMVPPFLPAPELLVTVTGVLELAGAAGLVWSRTAPWAAGGLSALLLAMFPANVYKALTDPTIGVDDQLGPRTALQVLFLAATLAVVVHHMRSPTRTSTGAGDPPDDLPSCGYPPLGPASSNRWREHPRLGPRVTRSGGSAP